MDKYPWQSKQNKRRQQRRPQPKARQPLKKKIYKIKQRSDKEEQRQKRYGPIARQYKLENPICEFPGCKRPTTDVHHSEGREGELLFDVSKFKHLCRPHHTRVNEHHEEAVQLGLSSSRLAK